jgi:hypothetical protein
MNLDQELCEQGPIHTTRHVSVPSPFRRRSVTVPSEWSVFTLSAVFIHLPEQHMKGGLRLFPVNMQPNATEYIFRYLLIIRTSVIIES